ncbi:MAG: SDR family oxidoreductase [Candidatus Omnitrophica bacterium]|nr:SDR family oxidoreductase [Candidatus Omnitrophota bacterium]
MKILIIGASGLLGKELMKDFSNGNEVCGTYSTRAAEGLIHLDMSQKAEIKDVFGRIKPEAVIIPGSITAVDFSEQNQDLAWRVNVEGIKNVAVLSKKAGAFVLYYSTDYIFDGKAGPYSETDKPNPINFYGRTKLEAERVIQKELKGSFLIIRPCSIYGYEKNGNNFAMQVLTSLKADKNFTSFRDQYGTPTYSEDLSEISLKLFSNKKEGIFNVAGPDFINRVQFSKDIADVFGLDAGLIKEIGSTKGRQLAKRPLRGGFKIDKLKRELGFSTLPLKEGLIKMKEESKKG